MPKDMPVDVKVEAVAGKPVELPSGDFIANAAMSRVGTDLHLTAPDGHTVVVQGYFAQANPPDLVTHDGARLTSAMVDAFVPPEHAGQYASSGQIATDASPAGHITQEVGDAHIIHADGTRVAATVGTPIYQGDVVETAKTGAVNIQFADNTTFAISENARMSVDQFVYHAADHSGSTFFSMLQGVFVYTSGLIGKTDAANVGIETPVGSIGIRGTVIAGHIMPAGQQSQITIVDGAITVTNGAGTQDLSTSLSTVAVTGYQSALQPIQLDASTFNTSYHAVAPVMGDYLTHFTGMNAPSSNAPAAPATTAPADTAPATHAPTTAPETAPAPAGSAAPAPTDTHASTTTTAPATTTTTILPTTTLPGTTAGTPASYPTGSGSSFSTTSTSSTMTSTSSGTGSATTSTTGTSDTSTQLQNTGTAGGAVSNTFSIGYSPASSSVAEFAHAGTVIGTITPQNGNATLTYTISVQGAPQEILPGAVHQTVSASDFAIVGNQLVVVNPLAFNYLSNGSGINLTVTATEVVNGTSVTATESLLVNIANNHIGDTSLGAVDASPVGSFSGGTINADFIAEQSGGNNTLVGNGGADVILGGSGNDVIVVADNTFTYVDGGAGTNTLQLSGTSGQTWDFTSGNLAGAAHNIQNINLAIGGENLIMNAQAVYDMTHGSSPLTVSSSASTSDTMHIDSSLKLVSDSWNGSTLTLNYSGSVNGNEVALNVNESSTHSVLVDDPLHQMASTIFAPTAAIATANDQLIVGASTSSAQTLSDGTGSSHFTGDILIGNSLGLGNSIDVANSQFGLIDGGTETSSQYNTSGGNWLYLNATPGSLTLDFTGDSGPVGAVRNIDNIQLEGNSIKLNIQDVFNMTNAADGYTLVVTNNSSTVSNATVVTDGTSVSSTSAGTDGVFHLADAGLVSNLLGGTLGLLGLGGSSSSTSVYVGHYMGQNVTLVVEGTSPSGLLGTTPASINAHTAAH